MLGEVTAMKTKTFDCVEMKRKIQEQILSESADRTEEEIDRRRREEIARDPILGPIWERKPEKMADSRR